MEIDIELLGSTVEIYVHDVREFIRKKDGK